MWLLHPFTGFLLVPPFTGGTADRERRSNVQSWTSCHKGDSKETAGSFGEKNQGPVWGASEEEEVGGVQAAECLPTGRE